MDFPTPLPPGTRLNADPSLELRQEGRLLCGGAPMRFIRVSPAGADLVRSLLAGAEIPAGTGAQKLVRRLIEAGMAHPDMPPIEPVPGLTVVIPVRDDADGLAVTLAALGGRWPVVVVDDASVVPVAVSDPSVQVLRRAAAGGPGVARQTALEQVRDPLVAFVDAGVEINADELVRLCRWFADDAVVAVGPRVMSRPGTGAIAAYDAQRSPLDLGRGPSVVGPGRMVAYLPSAALVARTAAVVEAGGFDHGLRYGEDVDLVWRLAGRGTVRYDPSVVARHPPRPDLRSFARQRLGYGSSAAPLAQRHGSQVAPVRLSAWSLACWALLLARRPVAAGVLVAGTAVALGRKLEPVMPDGKMHAAGLTVRGHWLAGGTLADASVREWWPITVLAAMLGWRRQALGLAGLALVRRWRTAQGPVPDRIRDAALGLIDTGSYGVGVWMGASRQRSFRCLLPRLTSWPGRLDKT